MNRTIRAAIAAVLVLVIAFSAISICQSIDWKLDVTDQKIYTLSQETKNILARLHQPIRAKLYYAKTATLKAPDQIRYFNNYFHFVKALLEEYVAASNGMVQLEIIDPRPFSEEEEEALRYGLKRFPITQEENFFFGLVIQTQFGVEKVIPFFSPDRQNFVEYDISYLIDTAITRQKRTIGIMSSLPVMGEGSPYLAELRRRQGQRPNEPWTIVQQLRRKYEVKQIPTDVNDINDIDILLIIHPKDLPDQTLFAIDQFVLKGGRVIVCVDPYCFADRVDPMNIPMGRPPTQASELNRLLRNWGLEMPANTFAGDRLLAMWAAVRANQRAEKIIGYLNLQGRCFNRDNVITAQLNQVRVLFAGILKEVEPADSNDQDSSDKQDPNTAKAKASQTKLERVALITTTESGNSFSVSSPYELMFLDPSRLMTKFIDGTKPVSMGYLVTGRFKSAFPNGIDIEVEAGQDPNDPNQPKKLTKHITGLTEAAEDCAVVVFADVDFISDEMAYQDSIFGKIVVGDNSALLLNAIDDLAGSTDLISIRSRGNFRRPFTVVDEIEKQAEAETAAEIAKIEAAIAGYNKELQSILASAKEGQEEVVGSSILQKRRELELKIRQAEREKRQVNRNRRQRIDRLGKRLQYANTLAAPAVILLIAIGLGIQRGLRRRHYISQASGR